MKIDLYTRCWNDSEMLDFFFRHYDPFVDRYVIYDDESTDDSLEKLAKNPKVEVRSMPTYCDMDSRILSNHAILEECWKESRFVADWVIVTDIDEHLYHPNIKHYLKVSKKQGVTIIPAMGYQMLSEVFPQPNSLLCKILTKGAPSSEYSKLNIFAPNELDATNFKLGRHRAQPTGNVIAPYRDELRLLHYKHIGFERLMRRHELYLTRQRKKDLENGWGNQYSWSEEQFRDEWKEFEANLIDIKNSDFKLWENKGGERWWEECTRAPRSSLSSHFRGHIRKFFSSLFS
ncbi:MAG: glycosyltransferase family 2 protein [Methylobacter sp.]|uniref:glycosyltransferase family 2 protein n=1 Tax=Methylobacter sp. TaxID=2051955 RepID=UPI002730B26F|nr:glycosyltransferase family 2 protein [Methylobacter sp.]MDP1664047.1 glycosyltransferase family 2 protein [Methylobacter sp.]